ncbi:hypothetical protein, partial [Jatrophihabitans endophyticus]|uniref:hypothetical protein n=1 Tax=Jatrophihabitans endophyticus TaxID=1206085 RepID=UPI0019DE4E9D
LVDRLLGEVRLPSGARQRSSAPTRALRRPAETQASTNLVDHHHWWTTHRSVHAVLTYVRHHAARGLHLEATGSSFGPHGQTVHDVLFAHRATRYAYGPEVDVEAVRTATGSAVRADAQAVWLPRRPASSFVRHATSARVVVVRHASYPGAHRLPTVRRTLGAHRTARLETVLNQQTTTPPVTFACPADFPGVRDRISFVTPRGRVVVGVHLTGCGDVEVRAPHHHAVSLDGADGLDRAVRHLLHLPKRYGY